MQSAGYRKREKLTIEQFAKTVARIASLVGCEPYELVADE